MLAEPSTAPTQFPPWVGASLLGSTVLLVRMRSYPSIFRAKLSRNFQISCVCLCCLQGIAQTTSTQALEDERGKYEATLKSQPDDPEAQAGEVRVSERMALSARAAGDSNLALKTLLQARTYAPDNARLLYDLGVLEDEMHLFLDADKVLTHAAQVGSDDPNLLYAAGRVELDLGQLDAAEDKLAAYLKQRPGDASAHYALGRVYRQGAKFDQADSEFKRSIEIQPMQTEAYYQLGETELARGQLDEAVANFKVTLNRNPKHAGALVGTGIAFYKRKLYSKALAPLQKAVAAEGTYQPGHYYLGLTLQRLGRKDEASKELAEATRLAAIDNKQSAQRLRIHDEDDSSPQ